MRLAVLTTSYPRSQHDVAGRFVRDFSVSFARRGHDVTVLAAEDAVIDHAREPEVTLHTVPYVRPRALERTFYGSGAPENLSRDRVARLGAVGFPAALLGHVVLHTRDADAFVSHWALPCSLVAGAVRGRRPHLSVMHSADVHLLARLPGRIAFARAIERSSTALWFVSPTLRDTFERCLGRPIRRPVLVCPMAPELDGVGSVFGSTEARRPNEDEDVRSGAPLVVLAMSRIEPIKGLDRLVRALADVPRVRLVIAGDGSERKALADLATRCSVSVEFVGMVRGETKAAWLDRADIFVACSRVIAGRSEGAPVAVTEAMSRGVPIVATNTGGLPALIGDAGMLVPDDDVPALRAAVVGLLENASRRAALGAAGRRRAARLTWPTLCADAESLLRGTSPGTSDVDQCTPVDSP